MADTAKRLYGPAQMTVAGATLYTVPVATTSILRHVRVVNTSGSDRQFYLSIGADAAGTRLFSGRTIPAGGELEWSGFVPMDAGETLRGNASADSSLTLIASGVEVS